MRLGHLKSRRKNTLVILRTLTAHGRTSKLPLDARNERRSPVFGLFNQRPASVAFMPIISMINPLKVLIFSALFLLLTVFPLALHFKTPFCCDRRHDDDFSLEAELPGFLYTGAIDITPVQIKAQERYRPTWERPALDELLIAWVENEVRQDRLLRPAYHILSLAQRDTLQRTIYSSITSPSAIAQILDETPEWEEEWAAKIYKIICDYQPVRTPKPSNVMADL